MNMKVYETSLRIPKVAGNAGLLENFTQEVKAHLPPNTFPVRFAVTQTDDSFYYAELGVLEHEAPDLSIDSIFRFSKRPIENTREFNAVLLVPTGIGALIGGARRRCNACFPSLGLHLR